MIPTFGLSTIRKFSYDAAGMKKMAARTFEDLLQVRLLYSFSKRIDVETPTVCNAGV